MEVIFLNLKSNLVLKDRKSLDIRSSYRLKVLKHWNGRGGSRPRLHEWVEETLGVKIPITSHHYVVIAIFQVKLNLCLKSVY